MISLESLVQAVRGTAQTVAAYQVAGQRRRSKGQEEGGCTPCEAHGYVADLRKNLSGGLGRGR